MKKIFLAITFLLISSSVNAKVQIGPLEVAIINEDMSYGTAEVKIKTVNTSNKPIGKCKLYIAPSRNGQEVDVQYNYIVGYREYLPPGGVKFQTYYFDTINYDQYKFYTEGCD